MSAPPRRAARGSRSGCRERRGRTKTNIAALTLTEGRRERLEWDDALPGFGIRLRAGRSKTFVVQYRIGHLQRRLKLGTVQQLNLDTAREMARKALAKVTLGADPQAEKSLAKAKAVNTLGKVVDPYLEYQQRRLKPRSYLEVKRHLKAHWKPLHGLALHEVRRADVAAKLRALAGESGNVAADRARASLSALFNWAIREGLTEADASVKPERPSCCARRT